MYSGGVETRKASLDELRLIPVNISGKRLGGGKGMVPTLQNMKHSHTRLCEGSGGRMLTNTEEGKLTQQEVESFLKVTNASEDIKSYKN